MVIDTSALLAILLSEPDALDLVEEIAAEERRLVGAPTLAEATAVMLARKGSEPLVFKGEDFSRTDVATAR